jgi:hypothetical protein
MLLSVDLEVKSDHLYKHLNLKFIDEALEYSFECATEYQYKKLKIPLELFLSTPFHLPNCNTLLRYHHRVISIRTL